MTVGEKIKYFRTMHGFTQEQLVQATGLSISTLQKYESDERKPKPEQLLKISQALGISINIFPSLIMRNLFFQIFQYLFYINSDSI